MTTEIVETETDTANAGSRGNPLRNLSVGKRI